MLILALDPGRQGAGTVIDIDGHVQEIIALEKMTDQEIADFFRRIQTEDRLYCDVYAFIEDVNKRFGDTPTTAWVLGGSKRFLEGMLVAFRLPFERLGIQRWQKIIGLKYPKNATTTEKERAQKQRVNELFPGLQVTNKTAASVLQAEAGRRIIIQREKRKNV